MDDSLLVRVPDAVTDLQKELKTFFQAELFFFAVAFQRHPRRVFHGEVGVAIGGRAGVEDLGDVDVVHERDRLALRLEAHEELLGGQSAAYELQGDLALDRFGLRRKVDNAHASLAKRTHETIGANLEGLLGKDCLLAGV